VLTAEISKCDQYVPLDPRFIEVCEPDSLQVCGIVPDLPVAIGAVVEAAGVRVRVGKRKITTPIQVVIRVTGIRKGFVGHRFPDRTRKQFLANERFIRSAYPGAGR
jgi:hypothetical protein